MIDLSELSENVDFTDLTKKYEDAHPTTTQVMGKPAYFLKLTADKPTSYFIPVVVNPDNDIAKLPIHNYVDCGEDVHQSFVCRELKNEECPLCADGLKVSYKYIFKAIMCQDEDDNLTPVCDLGDGAYKIEYVTVAKTMKEQLDNLAKVIKKGYMNSVLCLSRTGELKLTKYDLQSAQDLPKTTIDGKKMPDLNYEALMLGLKKYPTIQDYVSEMTSDELYAKYIPMADRK